MKWIARWVAAPVVLFGSLTHAGTGALDPTFGSAGRVFTNSGQSDSAYALALQADGKPVVAGAFGLPSPSPQAVARYSSSGIADSAFGTAGVATSNTGFCGSVGCYDIPYGIAVQADGKIITAATHFSNAIRAPTSGIFKLTRYGATGTLDATFGLSGSVFVAPQTYAVASAILLQPDGRIVTIGTSQAASLTTDPNSPPRFTLARHDASGTAGPTFNGTGVVQTAIGTADYAQAAALQSDGRIVVVGTSKQGARFDFAIARYSAAGVVETTDTKDIGEGDDGGLAVVLQSDGKIVVGGVTGQSSMVLRFTAPGTFDTTFGTGGKFVFAGTPVRALAVQPDGKILALTDAFHLWRLNVDGTPDTTFGTAGRVAIAMGTNAAGRAMVLQGDGRVLVAGAGDGGNGADMAVARLDPTRAMPLDATSGMVAFGGQSLRTTSPSLTVTFASATTAATLTSISATAPFALVSHNCTTIAANGSCTATVTFTPTAEGAATGTLLLVTSAGNVAVSLTGTGEKSLVTHYYRSILRRAPDAGGKAYWDAEAVRVQALGVNVNEVWFALAGSFYGSAEYFAQNRDNAAYVTDLYNTFFNRAPDTDGFSSWTALLASGMPREVVLASFMFSSEFQTFTQAIFGTATTRKEIDTVVDFYRGVLGRLPDSAGFNFWLGRFRAAQCEGSPAVTTQAESISNLYATSQEYVARNRSNAQYVGDMYNAFLRRGGDLAGVQFWISELTTGARTRENVRQQFVASPEFSARVASIITQGCLPGPL